MAKLITLDNLSRFKSNCDDEYMRQQPIDGAPTDNSKNLVTSGGVKTYIDGLASDKYSYIQVKDVMGTYPITTSPSDINCNFTVSVPNDTKYLINVNTPVFSSPMTSRIKLYIDDVFKITITYSEGSGYHHSMNMLWVEYLTAGTHVISLKADVSSGTTELTIPNEHQRINMSIVEM